VCCGSAAVTERPERTARGYRRFRCRACGKQFNERSGGLLNRTQYPSDLIALVALWRLRYRLTLRDLADPGAAVPDYMCFGWRQQGGAGQQMNTTGGLPYPAGYS
jgi:hypothetical protein